MKKKLINQLEILCAPVSIILEKAKDRKKKLIEEAMRIIEDYEWIIFKKDIERVLKTCESRTQKKYVRHIFGCGKFYNDVFSMPSTQICMELKVRKRPLNFSYEDGFK